MNNVSICKSSAVGSSSSIVIIVHTARSHFMERHAIRETWGSIKLYKGWKFHLVFLLGTDPTGNDELDLSLRDEYRQYGDMVMGNFVDSYKNLTYKHLMGYKWVMSFCSDAKLVLKTDDDMFVDIFQLVEVMLVELVYSNNAYACLNMKGNKPIRSVDNVWYVSEDLYSGEEYPEFCSGTAYLMKTQVAAKIFSVSNQTKFFWIDDVYVTGILREHYSIQMNYSDHKRLDILWMNGRYNLSMSWRNEIESWCNTGLNEQFKYTFALLNKDKILGDMFCIWNKVRLLKFAMNHAFEQPTPQTGTIT
ncbi:beta-1,3-galactosyltransferase 1-like [Bradysia coprophila]|uniref:beta-1,3-galactosyltransferase 1-like n=1 Tax=Bradysia coprophila TaxID=38358 RepID=UPI00187D9DEF|nr:beta-1,3-galactosyltransferase 1-like [Bradysia coprophila]